jgi:hypothetical protein
VVQSSKPQSRPSNAAHRGKLQAIWGVYMPIIVAEETVFPLGDVPKHLSIIRGGKKLHKATAFRWAARGIRGVKLETIRVGGSLCTTLRALQEFCERLSQTDGQPAAMPSIRTPAARARALAKAEAELTRLGI